MQYMILIYEDEKKFASLSEGGNEPGFRRVHAISK